MKGTVAPPSRRSTAVRTCASATRSSAAICRVILSIKTAVLAREAGDLAIGLAQRNGTVADTHGRANFSAWMTNFPLEMPMRARVIVPILAILLLAGFAAQNWSEISRPVPFNVAVTTVQAPLGLILLGLLALACVLFVVFAGVMHTQHL